MNTANFPKEIQAVLPILQGLDDGQRFSLIEWLASRKTKKSESTTNQAYWQDFIEKRNEILKTENYDDFLADRNQSLPQIRQLFDDMADLQ